MIIQRSVFLALTAVMLTLATLWFTNRAVTPKTASWEDVLTEANNGGYRLITTIDLAKRYLQDDSNLLLVDTRQEWEYRAGHIRGALNFSMEPTWWARRQKADALESFLGKDKSRPIVFY